MGTDPKPPTGTKAAGRRLWTSITANYDLEQHELALLRETVRVVDLLDGLDAVVRKERRTQAALPDLVLDVPAELRDPEAQVWHGFPLGRSCRVVTTRCWNRPAAGSARG